MADKDDFAFDEEESDFDSVQESEDWGEYEAEKKKGGSKRLLYLLLLLLVLAGAAAFFFLSGPQDGPSAPVKVVNVQRKPIAAPMPKPVATQPTQSSAQPTTATAKPAAAEPKTADAPAVSAAAPSTPTPAEATTATPAEPAASVPVEEVSAKTVAPAKPAATPEPAVTTAKVFEPEPAPKPKATGAYTLTAGAFAMQSSVDRVVKKIRQLGYEPQLQPIQRKVEMTRLLVGVYPSGDAVQKLRQVKAVSPGAFTLIKGGQTAVYAGSFIVLDQARVFADTTLAKNGIRVTEEPVKMDQTLQRVMFGSFASRDDAAKAARDAASKGLEAQPVKK